jgi:DNA-binding HxlR family transcriptional regulator
MVSKWTSVVPRIRHDRPDCSPGGPVEAALQFIDGKWKGGILYHLIQGTLRFSEIRRRLPNVTPRMFAEVPPKVEYSLTSRGRSLEKLIFALKAWGIRRPWLKGEARRSWPMRRTDVKKAIPQSSTTHDKARYHA